MNLQSPLNCLTQALTRSTRHLQRGFEAAAEAAGQPMTAPQFTTLARLSFQGPLPVGVLAEALATDRTTLTRNLAVMQARGWLEPQDTDDKRQRQWALSPAGQAALTAILPLWRDWQAGLVQRLGPDAATTLLTTLKTLQSD